MTFQFTQDGPGRMNRATQNRGVDLVEEQAGSFQALPGGHRFRPSGVGNVNINPIR